MSKLPADHYGKCPECGNSWDGGDIPERIRDYYSPPYKWSRIIGIEIPGGYDGISYYRCPDCPAIWDILTGDKVSPAIINSLSEMEEFRPFPKIPRLSRDCWITEKLDGTNGCIYINENGHFKYAGSRNRWITPQDDNYGFARWAHENHEELQKLGPGTHFGEWWGSGIQCGYGLKEKRFSLFNVDRWSMKRPACCDVVPVLYKGIFTTDACDHTMFSLEVNGSAAAPGFMKPEGIMIYHVAANQYFKKTIHKDSAPKGIES